MRALIAILLLAVSLAGCSDAAPEPADDPFDDLPTDPVDGDKGVIRGIVIDAAIQPIEGAKVAIVGRGLETTSNDAGAFLFSNLDPGTYFIQVSKPGYSQVQQSVNVVAGVAKPDIVKVLVERQPGSEPRAETIIAEGFIQCGAGTPLTIHECPVLNDQDKSQLEIPAPGQGPDTTQVEVYWESTQPAGEQLYLIIKYCGTPCDWGFDGRFSEGVMDAPHVVRTGGDNRTELQVGVWASPGGPANGTGVALDQTFFAYVTFFYNMEPDEDWTFMEDGHHPMPA